MKYKRNSLWYPLILSAVVIISILMAQRVDDQGFVLYYGILWFALLLLAKIFQWKVLLPIIIYALAGISRLIAGLFFDMSHFVVIWVMMVLGILIYLIIVLNARIYSKGRVIGNRWFGYEESSEPSEYVKVGYMLGEERNNDSGGD